MNGANKKAAQDQEAFSPGFGKKRHPLQPDRNTIQDQAASHRALGR